MAFVANENHSYYCRRPVALSDQARFKISVVNEPGETAAIQICDRKNRTDLAVWHGEAARSLLHAGVLPSALQQIGQFLADKNSVWHLMLAAAAINIEFKESPCEFLDKRLKALGIGLRADCKRVARLLFEYPGQHLSVHDVQCIFTLRWLVKGDCVPDVLAELCQLNVIQCIHVDDANVFYDIDTRPHLHVFDARKRQLFDAPSDGVLRATQ